MGSLYLYIYIYIYMRTYKEQLCSFCWLVPWISDNARNERCKHKTDVYSWDGSVLRLSCLHVGTRSVCIHTVCHVMFLPTAIGRIPSASPPTSFPQLPSVCGCKSESRTVSRLCVYCFILLFFCFCFVLIYLCCICTVCLCWIFDWPLCC